ncbi:hypothetical protein [Rheinheimera sp.]|uniref:hypothetical protein n=1 Tax=Rheinheimera sp. TaxID=1869214 RepID=UPI002734B4C3|nr:hypothetical protein [Rheinheimera sp.]MDP2713545.1 hypothetical protein [Rheinheimera sp.]
MSQRFTVVIPDIIAIIAGTILLAGCTALATVGKATMEVPATLGSISSHVRAKRNIIDKQDLSAAIGYLAGERYTFRQHVYAGDTNWWTINWAASTIVIKAHAEGKAVPQEVLYRAYRIKTVSYDLAESGYYLDLLRQKQLADYGENSPQVLLASLDPKRLLLEYLRIGGYIDYTLETDLDIYALLTLQENDYRDYGLDVPLLLSFPLRMQPGEREAFFRLIKFPLPESQWHDAAAVQQVMLTPWYLVELSRSYRLLSVEQESLLWALRREVSDLHNETSLCVGRHHGFKLTPMPYLAIELVTPPQCLQNQT